MSEIANLAAYFERIGFAGSIAPNLQTLQALHQLHVAAIPFENIAPLLGQPVSLEQPALEQKLLRERRGGYCFEQNMLFWRVLRELGYNVRAHLGRVLWKKPVGVPVPRSHMVLSIEINGVPYLADVGFGGLTLTAPLRLRSGIEQETPHETFRLTGDDGDFCLEVRIGEEWHPLYEFDLANMIEPDFIAPNYYAATHPNSIFRSELRMAISGKDGRLGLLDNRLTTYPVDGAGISEILPDADALRDSLSNRFGINLSAEDMAALGQRIFTNAEQASA